MKKLQFLLFFAATLFVATTALATPRSEYPRPQMEREQWVNLNGEWSYEFDFGGSGYDRKLHQTNGYSAKITVPFCPESSLSGVGHKDFIDKMWYHRSIEIPSTWSGKKILLNFGAVDYIAEIYIDGVFVDRHFGGSSSFAIDLSRYVKAGSKHDLVVYVVDNNRSSEQTKGKQTANGYYSNGCLYTRVTGIWQTVWLEAVADQGIKNVHYITDIDQNQVVVKPLFYHEGDARLVVEIKDGAKVVARKEALANNTTVVVLPLKNPKLWSPDSPFLYDVELKVVGANGKILDQVKSYLGMRKVHTQGNRLYLNNKPFYQRLVLDQGYYPDGIWTAPSDEALKNDIILSKQAGFNGARLHQKVFEERYHYWADKLGYITWGESASWGMDITNEKAVRNFIAEWNAVLVRDRNHPSIIVWTPFNETWEPDKTVYPRMITELYNTTKVIDPTRPINDASGDSHVMTDIWGVHTYEQEHDRLRDLLKNEQGKELYTNSPNKFVPYQGQPYIVDEFGGIMWVPKSEAKSDEPAWGYGEAPKLEEEFYKRLEGQIDALFAHDHVWGFCYTQLTDVEQEQNGIYLYSREPKFDMARIRAIFGKELPEYLKK